MSSQLPSENKVEKVDHSALRTNQVVIILLNSLGFVLNLWYLPSAVAFIMLLGTIIAKPGFLPVYSFFLKPLGIVKPDIKEDSKAPHRFAQGFGAVVMVASSVFLWTGYQIAGWALAGLVVLLAALNVFAGFCAGCFVYYQLGRFGVPGFKAK